MKKLIFALSNRNGCSVSLAKRISKDIGCENVILREKSVKYCAGCLTCHNQPQCIIQDDMQEIYKKMLENDLFVFITPNYFDGLSGFAKNFFDRLHPFYKQPLLQNKKVIFIFVGGGSADGTLKEMRLATKGIVLYLKFDIIKNFAIKSLDVANLSDVENEICQISDFIKNL